METVLYVTAETLRRLAIPLQAFIPAGAGALLDLLGVPPDARDFFHASADHALVSGAKLPAPAPVFPRFVEEEGKAPNAVAARLVMRYDRRQSFRRSWQTLLTLNAQAESWRSDTIELA